MGDEPAMHRPFAQLQPLKPKPQRSPARFAVPARRAPSVSADHMKKVQRDFDALYRQSPVPRMVVQQTQSKGFSIPSAKPNQLLTASSGLPPAEPEASEPAVRLEPPIAPSVAAAAPSLPAPVSMVESSAAQQSVPKRDDAVSQPAKLDETSPTRASLRNTPQESSQGKSNAPGRSRMLAQLEDFTTSGSKDIAPSSSHLGGRRSRANTLTHDSERLGITKATSVPQSRAELRGGSNAKEPTRESRPRNGATEVQTPVKSPAQANTPEVCKESDGAGACGRSPVCDKVPGHIGRCNKAHQSAALTSDEPQQSKDAAVVFGAKSPKTQTLLQAQKGKSPNAKVTRETPAIAAHAADGANKKLKPTDEPKATSVSQGAAAPVQPVAADVKEDTQVEINDRDGEMDDDASGSDGNDRVLTDEVRSAVQVPQAVVSKAVPKRVPKRSAPPAQRSVKRLKKHDGTSQVAIPEASQIGVKAVIASEPALLRRSGRSRSKVCAFWHGEVPEYKKQTDGLKVLVGVIEVPTWHNESAKTHCEQPRTGPAHKRTLTELKTLGSRSGARTKRKSIRPLKELSVVYSSDEQMENEQSDAEPPNKSRRLKKTGETTKKAASGEPTKKAATKAPQQQANELPPSKAAAGRKTKFMSTKPIAQRKGAPVKQLRAKRPRGESNGKSGEDKWTAAERDMLKKAYVNVPPSKPNFWKVVARMVGRPAAECAEEYQLLHKKPNRAKQALKQGQLQVEDLELSKKGTMKHKRQVRKLVQRVNKGHKDDLFDKVAAGTIDQFGDDSPTALPERFAATSPQESQSEDEKSPGLLRPVDRAGYDPYINRFNKGSKRGPGKKPQGSKHPVAKRALPRPKATARPSTPVEEEEEEEPELEPAEYYWSE